MRSMKTSVASAIIMIVLIGDLRGEILTFQLQWSGASFGNSATATAILTLDDTIFPNPPNNGTFVSNGILSFDITVSGAAVGNGAFTITDFTPGIAFSSNGVALDLTMELVGQTVGGGFLWGMPGSGDFNVAAATMNGAPSATSPFRLTTDNATGDNLLLTNFAPIPPTTSWTNTAGGDFEQAANWDNGVPDSLTDAFFNIPDTYAVNLNQDEACDSLRFLDGIVTLTPQTLSLTSNDTIIDGGYLIMASGNLGVSSVTQTSGVNTGSLQIADGSASVLGSTILGSAGNITVTGGTLTTDAFDNTAGGTFDLDGGRFEFGTTSLTEFNSINAVSGSLAGDVTISGVNDVAGLLFDLHVEVSDVTVLNSGILFGSAFLDVALTNQPNGELRTFSDDWVRFAGIGNTNAGEINNFGGTVEFAGDLVNEMNAVIAGRGLFIVDGKLTNDGGLGFSGDFSDVLGDIDNSITGIIAIGGNNLTTFFDDVEMLDPMNPDVQVAGTSVAVFFGSFNGGNSGTGVCEVFGDLRPGNSPAAVSFGGDLFVGASATTEIEIGGLFAGNEHDQLNVAGDLSLAGTLNVTLINGFATGPGQQFTVAQVDGNLSGTFSGLSDGAMIPGTDLTISYAGGDGNDIVLFTDDPVLLGDVNLDGVVNLLDVAPFVDRISTGTFQAEADVNQDGVVNLLDVAPFILILSGG